MFKIIQEKLLKKNIRLCAVSKSFPESKIMEIYDQGQRVFGENKVQELLPKFENLPKDISWHFIGHLQSNKVKYIAEFIDLIHSVDSSSLLKEINKRGRQNNRRVNVLLQVKIAKEESKFGIAQENLPSFVDKIPFDKYQHVHFSGLMGMATYTENEEQIHQEMKVLKMLYDEYKPFFNQKGHHFETCSMGMSGDYEIAIEEGSNLVRIGSLIFGDRNTTT